MYVCILERYHLSRTCCQLCLFGICLQDVCSWSKSRENSPKSKTPQILCRLRPWYLNTCSQNMLIYLKYSQSVRCKRSFLLSTCNCCLSRSLVRWLRLLDRLAAPCDRACKQDKWKAANGHRRPAAGHHGTHRRLDYLLHRSVDLTLSAVEADDVQWIFSDNFLRCGMFSDLIAMFHNLFWAFLCVLNESVWCQACTNQYINQSINQSIN